MKRSKSILSIFALLTIILLSLPYQVNAEVVKTRPVYGGVKVIGGSGNDIIYNIITDSQGNYYYSGVFNDTVNFASDWGGSDIKTASGTNNVFITKIGSDDSYKWSKTLPVTLGFPDTNRIKTDSKDNVFILSTFTGTVNFAADWGSLDSKTSQGSNDGFITKINSDGSYSWTKRIGGTGLDGALTVAFDLKDNIYTSGVFSGTVDFAQDWGGSSDSKTSAGSYDSFIMKINSDGSYGWTKRLGGTGNDNSFYNGNDISFDSLGNLYLVSGFSGTVNFAADWGGIDNKISAGSSDIGITMLDDLGNYQWTKRIGGSGLEMTPNVKIDSNNNIYINGRYSNSVNFAEDWGGTESRT